MTALRALMRKEAAVLFGSPVAYLVLTMVALLTAITFFEHHPPAKSKPAAVNFAH